MAARNVGFWLLVALIYMMTRDVNCQAHLGCHLFGGPAVETRRHNLVTLPWCKDVCRMSTYFALRRRDGNSTALVDCFCADVLPEKIDESRCNYRCQGTRCGGATDWQSRSLYTTCPRGRYGLRPLCGRRCHCKKNTACDISDGHCTSGCQPHFTGNACNVCEGNWEGASCDVCPQNWEGTNCDRCDSGWQDEDCLQDVDECRAGMCEQRCINFDGGFNCSCKPGYLLESNQRNCTDCHFVEYIMKGVGVTSECGSLKLLEELTLADCFLEACRHGADVINYNMGPDLCDLRLCDRQASGSYMITLGNKGWAVYVLDDDPTGNGSTEGPEAPMGGSSPSWVPVVAGVLAAVAVIAAAVTGFICWWRRKNASRPTSGDDVIQSANQNDQIATSTSQQAVCSGKVPDQLFEEISQQSSEHQREGPTSASPHVSALYDSIGPPVELNNQYDTVHIYSS